MGFFDLMPGDITITELADKFAMKYNLTYSYNAETEYFYYRNGKYAVSIGLEDMEYAAYYWNRGRLNDSFIERIDHLLSFLKERTSEKCQTISTDLPTEALKS